MNIYERRFYAGSNRDLREQAEKLLCFFADCLQERAYPHADKVGQELLSLIEPFDALLRYSAFRDGFVSLQTDELQITAWAVYDKPEEEDLGVPSLRLLGVPPTEVSYVLTFSGKPYPSLVYDTYLSPLIAHHGLLHIKLDIPFRDRGSLYS